MWHINTALVGDPFCIEDHEPCKAGLSFEHILLQLALAEEVIIERAGQ